MNFSLSAILTEYKRWKVSQTTTTSWMWRQKKFVKQSSTLVGIKILRLTIIISEILVCSELSTSKMDTLLNPLFITLRMKQRRLLLRKHGDVPIWINISLSVRISSVKGYLIMEMFLKWSWWKNDFRRILFRNGSQKTLSTPTFWRKLLRKSILTWFMIFQKLFQRRNDVLNQNYLNRIFSSVFK